MSIMRKKRELLRLLLDEGAVVLVDQKEIFRVRRELEEINGQLRTIGRNEGCKYAVGGNLGLIITKNNKEEGVKKIKNWLKNKPKSLKIIDPFIFSYNDNKKPEHIANLDEYVRYVCNFIPKVLNEVHIYSNESPKQDVLSKFESVLAESNIRMIRYNSSDIHDRFLIRNDRAAKVMGTSFTGLGSKLSMFASLAQEDLDALLTELESIEQV